MRLPFRAASDQVSSFHGHPLSIASPLQDFEVAASGRFGASVLSQSHPLSRAHFRTLRWPPRAISEHVLESQSHPLSRAHFKTLRWPHEAAMRQICLNTLKCECLGAPFMQLNIHFTAISRPSLAAARRSFSRSMASKGSIGPPNFSVPGGTSGKGGARDRRPFSRRFARRPRAARSTLGTIFCFSFL